MDSVARRAEIFCVIRDVAECVGGVERVDGGADEAGVVGLDGEDAGGGLQRSCRWTGDERSCAVVGGDSDVLEDVGADEEVGVGSKGIEGGERCRPRWRAC